MGLRILHVINNLSRGGAEILLKNTVNILTDDSHMVVFFGGHSELISDFRGDVSFLNLDKPSGIPFLAIRRLSRVIKDWNPDIIHSHLFNATLIARLAKPSHIPLISTLHSMYSFDAFPNRKALWIEKLTANIQDAIITVSRTVLEDYLRYIPFRGQVWVIPNFLTQNSFQSVLTNRKTDPVFKCVAVGNLKAVKNYHFMLEAFTLLNNEQISLDIYGEGGLENELRQYIQNNNLNVHLRGTIADVLSVLPGFNLFIQASLHEGFGISVLEATAAQLPVLLSDIPVFREITDGQAHFFPLNKANELAGKISELAENSDLRNTFIESAYSFVSNTNTEQIFKQKLTEVYYNLVNSKTR